MTETEDNPDTDSWKGFCLGCGYPLQHGSRSECPECGQGFDRSNRHTYGRSPRSGARQKTLWLWFASLLTVLTLSFAIEMTMLFLGWNPLLAFVLCLATAPLMLALAVMALIPSLDVRPPVRGLALSLPVLILLTCWPLFPGIAIPTANWPFRLSFLLHRPMVEMLAGRIRDVGLAPESARVGLLSFVDVRFSEPESPRTSNLGFQITGDGGGGIHLVQTLPGTRFVWFNTNWTMDLGNGWYLVEQD